MRVKLEDLSPEKRAAVHDFKTDITSVFNDLYEDKWDQERWDGAVGKPSSSPFSPSNDQKTHRVDVKHLGSKFGILGVGFEGISIDLHVHSSILPRTFYLHSQSC